MKFNELEIFINAHNEIVLQQKENVVRITADQAEITADEINGCASTIFTEMAKEKNKTQGK